MGSDKEQSTENLSDKTLNDTTSQINNIENISTNSKNSERKYICNYEGCNLAYFKQSRLDRHIRLHTGERPYKCYFPECTKAYTNSSHLRRHIETHNLTKKRLECSKCSLTLSNYYNLKRHYARVHDNVLTCNECNEKFIKKRQLIRHIALHNNVMYNCSQCDKKLTTMNYLKRHEELHKKGNKSYPCPLCSEVFTKWILLVKHKKAHHIKDFKCYQCKKVFANGNYLKNHLKTHNETRCVIPCPYENCEKSYFYKSNLTNHINYYHLNKKFICDICNTELSAKSKLIQHIQTHTNSKKKVKRKITKQRKIRKDAGIPRRSMVTVLSGLQFDQKRDAELLKRETNIELIITQDSYTNDQSQDVS
ncbi:PREDICTED: zinc finger protein 883-like [Polistes dominula]|uniref:Zinc finger protein 883-like n=1 Tax=Polistes dominula TaxID=743375 RepID=A0ABM1HVY9_POLDO|nr:PREDICTED: zinc finger protein 883-like [Polistes dominula]XP_015172126.1 PREDICTED: zinc finger protein 883-like [Polistes dominula]